MERAIVFSLSVLIVAAVMGACTSVEADLEGRPCSQADTCLEGFACQPATKRCVPVAPIACPANGTGTYCPSAVKTGDPCQQIGTVLPCGSDAIDCTAGCRSCSAGVWGSCSDPGCTPTNGGVEICDQIDNDCDTVVDDNATDCTVYYDDLDGDGRGAGTARCACTVPSSNTATNGDDCNDNDTDVWSKCDTCDDLDGDQAFSGCDRYTQKIEDCDDDPASCGALCTPGREELCNLTDHNCDGDPFSQCRPLRPSNLSAFNVCSVLTTPPTLGPSVVFNTETGTITGLTGGDFVYTEQTQDTTGPEVPTMAVFAARRWDIPSSTAVAFVGENAAVLVACDSVVVEGVVLACADGDDGGPGGFSGGSSEQGGSGPGGGGTGDETFFENESGGGGGGGHCGSGGGGGDGLRQFGSALSGGAGGASTLNPTLIPLVGGSGGAASLQDPPDGRPGGGGGGAVQFVAGKDVVVAGTMTACGATGAGDGAETSGAGGGAGGAILIEGLRVFLEPTAILSVNGGGGSGGNGNSTNQSTGGQSGPPGNDRALGGVGAAGGGSGGRGGAGSSPGGENGLVGNQRGGGGGGGAGYIRINTWTDGTRVLSPSATVSPAWSASCSSAGLATWGPPN